MSIIIRPETNADQDDIRQVNRLAFSQDAEARLVDALRDGGHVRASSLNRAAAGGNKVRGYEYLKRLFDNRGDWSSNIRNDIAHGDTSLSLATVASKYPSLYRHVTVAIVKLLNLPSGSLDEAKDY
jgi:hypothetical protein